MCPKLRPRQRTGLPRKRNHGRTHTDGRHGGCPRHPALLFIRWPVLTATAVETERKRKKSSSETNVNERSVGCAPGAVGSFAAEENREREKKNKLLHCPSVLFVSCLSLYRPCVNVFYISSYSFIAPILSEHDSPLVL